MTTSDGFRPQVSADTGPPGAGGSEGRGPEELDSLRLSRDAALHAAQAAVRDATRLTRLLTILNDTGTLDSILDRALSTLSELFAAEVVVLIDPAGTGSFAPLATIGLPEDEMGKPFIGETDTYVLQTLLRGELIVVQNATTDPAVEAQLRDLDVEAVIYLPITASHAPRGVLLLARCAPTPFVSKETGLLMAMAYRIGLAVEQAQRRAQLECIVHAERDIGLDLDEEMVVRRAANTFLDLVGAERTSFISLVGETFAGLVPSTGSPSVSRDWIDRFLKWFFAQPEATRKEVFNGLMPSDSVDGEDAAHGYAGAILVLPLGYDRLEGLLCAFRQAPTLFDEETLPIARLFAGQTSAALENARLYKAVRTELAEKRRAEAALRASEERHISLIRSVHDLIVILTPDNGVQCVNPAAMRVWGSDADIAEWFWDRIWPSDQEELRTCALRLGASPCRTPSLPVRVRHVDDLWHDYEVSLSNLQLESGGGGIVATFHDVTERKLHERQLEHLAFCDPLTGLANRAHFQDRLKQALEGQAVDGRTGRFWEKVAVIFFDLDNFKVVNDSLGHEAGDLLLKTVAERMRANLRHDDLGARLGGDEFTVLLESCAADGKAKRVAARLLDAIRQPVRIEGREVVVGGSFGIAFGKVGVDTADVLLRKADTAMYHAKSNGKNTLATFDSALEAAALRRLEVETDLRSAIAASQLRVFYQPIVDLIDGTTRGCEALVRWVHPERGLILPGDFIPIAEATGLIHELGRMVVDDCFSHQRRWSETCAFNGTVSLNLSIRRLLTEGFVDELLSAADRHGVATSSVVLEITENTFIRQPEKVGEILTSLRRAGFRIAIDDFATGYSSFAQLQRLPVDILKIDRSFIANVGRDGRDNAIVESIMTLARAFGLLVVAEGVESDDQRRRLVDYGCSVGQGFLFSPAIPGDAFIETVRSTGGFAPDGLRPSEGCQGGERREGPAGRTDPPGHRPHQGDHAAPMRA